LLDQPLMLAETIQKGDQKLRLRDEHRLPLWNVSSAGDR